MRLLLARTLFALALLVVVSVPSMAAEWSNIEPGNSTTEQVRDRFGSPSKETRPKVEGYETVEWVYEGDRAPAGMIRMTIEFGLLSPSGYKPSVVRLMKLEPKPFIFGRETIVQGWGVPDGVSDKDGVKSFFYQSGLFVIFDPEGLTATTMIFAVPQPETPAAGGSSAPSPPAAPKSGAQPKSSNPKQ